MSTVLITGCSSGFGLETARLFLDRGWNVVATMRTPQPDILPTSHRLRIVALDVTDEASIASAVESAGAVDALVNNAGFGFLNAVEGTSQAVARELFETNTLGTIAMTRALLPQFRAKRSGVVVNVSSTVTLQPLTLLSVYTASKAAVNAFSETVALELEPFGIRVRLVLPGRAPETRFGEHARAKMTDGIPAAYDGLAQRVFSSWAESSSSVTRSADVAEAIWEAVNNPASPMRIYAGDDAVALAQLVAH